MLNPKNSKTYKKLELELANRKWSLLSEYTHARVAVTLRCEHGHTFAMRPDNILYSPRCKRCPHCKPANAFTIYDTTYFYVIRCFINSKTLIKYGITNNLDLRMNRYKQKELISVKYFTDGFYAKQIENKIKSKLKYVTTKNEFGDGYTETAEDTQYNIELIKDLVWVN